MFTLKTLDLPRVTNYGDAVRVHERAVARYRPSTDEYYKLPGKPNSPQLDVRLLPNGDIRFRYHTTPVVTWHPDNAFTIEPGIFSRSTTGFAACFLPYKVRVYNECRVLVTDGRAYALPHTPVRFQPHTVASYNHPIYKLAMGAKTLTFRRSILRTDARRLLTRYPYAEYRAWYKAMDAVFDTRPIYRCFFGDADTVRHLSAGVVEDDEDRGWWALLHSSGGKPDNVRKAIYNLHRDEAYIVEQRNTLDVTASSYESAIRGWSIE